ncbi:MAG: alanine--tRNA ligase [Gemmatimonadetes bacterium]|nr:alanine--tRNA ligase [Gemmatimonadota bacterium]
MQSKEIRRKFIEYFVAQGHTHVPSSSLIPGDDPTLLFTNAGMVQFKRVFLGEETRPYGRATTVQKCLRVSGKHNDLEQVGFTARHHTFFEMLGNFSFGDYFKEDAIRFGWELCVDVYGLDPDRIFATVHQSDDEAFALWQRVAGLPPHRIFRFGDEDNFWQMAETGPCGPCSEIHYDGTGKAARRKLTREEFVALGDEGRILELWNLVFMQYDRSEDGAQRPLPKPSIDTGAGLERFAAVLQGVDSNFHTDLFMPLIRRAEEVVGRTYEARSPAGVSFRVVADHARAVAFLIADGVFPTNEGRGYVLRRILRRGKRHAWLLGRREPTVVAIVDEAIRAMGDVYPELVQRQEHIRRTTASEEERFLTTIDEGMRRLDELAPVGGKGGKGGRIPGAEAFKLYDTYGFPLDLTELVARERGYTVDIEGFERAMEEQRQRSREAYAAAVGPVDREALLSGWVEVTSGEQTWVGYDDLAVDTEVLAAKLNGSRVGLQLKENPFYAEAGGQISDTGYVEGDGWRLEVAEVARLDGRVAVFGTLEGRFKPGPVRAVVDPRRLDTQRNHTATHLLHAALRQVLGPHAQQAGSLVAPDRLRFDFTHPGPLTPEELEAVERLVNEWVLRDAEVRKEWTAYREAVGRGAMALFGEKYGETVRVVAVPGFSLELCGGCHVRSTGEIGLFKIVSETGAASGVRRVEAFTGSKAYEWVREQEMRLRQIAELLRVPPDQVVRRVEALVRERKEFERQLEDSVRRGATDEVARLVAGAVSIDGVKVVTGRIRVAGKEALRALGDRLRAQLSSGVAVLAAELGDGRTSFLAVVTEDLVRRGVRAGELADLVAASTGGRGGGRAHMAEGGVGDPTKIDEALGQVPKIVSSLLPRSQ